MNKILSFALIMAMLISSTSMVAGSNGPPVEKRVIIIYNHAVTDDDENELKDLGAKIKHRYTLTPAITAYVKEKDIPKIRNDTDVKDIFDDQRVHALLSDSIFQINADQVHSAGVTGYGARVCIVDTGVDDSHPALGSLINEYDFVNNDADAYDDNGHGTHVAGIVASTDPTYRGVAYGSSLMAAKVLDSLGNGWDSTVIAGIEWCVANGADVISMSLGGGAFSGACDLEPSAQASNIAVDQGVVVLAATGNDYKSNAISAPACGSKVIAIGAVDDNDIVTGYSNKGTEVDLVAPGGVLTNKIMSTKPGGGFTGKYGTSMATPHASGAAALLLEADPTLTPDEVRTILQNTAVDLGVPGFDTSYGYGRVDAYAAYIAVAGQPPTTQQLFMDDFESGILTGKWIETNELDWKIERPAERNVPGHPSSNLVAHADRCSSTAGCILTMSSPIDLSGFQSASLNFWRYVDNGLDNGEFLKVEAFDGSLWNEIFYWTHNQGDDDQWHGETFDLSGYLVNDFNLRFTSRENSNKEETEIDDVLIEATVEANQRPIAVAGPDETLSDGDGDGAELVTLIGSASYDPDPEGAIVSYEWKEGASVLGTTDIISDLVVAVGVHIIRLSVTDDEGAIGTDTIVVTVEPNQPPLADAGPDQTVYEYETVTLDGAASSDPDGTISAYEWRELTDWSLGFGSGIDGTDSFRDDSQGVALDSNGDLYVVGHKNYDWWIKKFDGNGIEDTLNWNHVFDTPDGNAVARQVVIDTDDNVYVGGYGTFGLTTGKDWWIKKFNSNGIEDVTWDKRFDANGGDDVVKAMVIDPNDQSLYVLGDATDPEGATSGFDWWVKKFDSVGFELWNRYYDASGTDRIFGAALDSLGDLYIAGQGKDLVRPSTSNMDWWVKKLDPLGDEYPAWDKTFSSAEDGANGVDAARQVVIDSDDNVYVGGYGWDIVSGSSKRDQWLKKFDSSGIEDTDNWDFGLDWGINDWDELYTMAIDPNDKDAIYTGGPSEGMVIPGIFGSGKDWWLQKFYPDGTKDDNWEKIYSTSDQDTYDVPNDLAVDAQGNVYAVGRAQDLLGPLSDYDWTIKKFASLSLGAAAIIDKVFSVGTHTVTLLVTDDGGATAMDTMIVTVESFVYQPPVAVAGPDQILNDVDGTGAEPVTLDGSLSYDPDGGELVSYQWTDGLDVDLGTTAIITPSLSVGVHNIALTVTDDEGATGTDNVIVTVNANQPPVADAGPDQTVIIDQMVNFNGAGSSDPDGMIDSFVWDFGDGSIPGTGETAIHSYSIFGDYEVELTVTDNGGAIASDTMLVTVTPPNQPPVADAGSDQAVMAGELVTFDGSASSDPDGTIVTYAWDFGDGSTGTGVTPTHTYLTTGIFTVSLTVTDDDGATDVDSMLVTVQQPAMEVTITKHIVNSRWDNKKPIGKAEVQISFTVISGSSSQVVVKEITDGFPLWDLETTEVQVKINGARYKWIIALDGNGDAIIDFGVHGITLSAGDVVEIQKLKLLNDSRVDHTLTAQILVAGAEIATDTLGFSF